VIYVASKTVHAPRWRRLRDEYRIPILSTWIDEEIQNPGQGLRDLWMRCVAESKEATSLIAYREPNDVLKGALVEIGGVPCRL
jgi:hypothetical protein